MDDAGNYICEVENEAEPIKQTNTLQILGELRKWFNIFSLMVCITKYQYSFCGPMSNNLVHREVRAVFE